MINDPYVLQHDLWGTIHHFKNGRDGATRCGNGTGRATADWLQASGATNDARSPAKRR